MCNVEIMQKLEELLAEEEIYMMSFLHASQKSCTEVQLIASGYRDYHKRIEKRIREEIIQ